MNPLFSFHFHLQACEILCCASLCCGSESPPFPEKKDCVDVTPCAERSSLAQRLCVVLHLLLGPETHQNLAEGDCHWIVFAWGVGGGRQYSQRERFPGRQALHTFRTLLSLWILTHPLDKLLSISFLAFGLSCLFILFQIGIISQHMFSWHIASSTLSAIKVSLQHHKTAQSVCC